jgi:hypothetical protein
VEFLEIDAVVFTWEFLEIEAVVFTWNFWKLMQLYSPGIFGN